ncbi:homeobox protein vex1 [Xenopus laevis]|uniref:Homeobox protein vex1 n=2 Tax=Xenopus laevis TaxID=8355 RepID=VEX1_XENLA|nr:homeobox protein vex1 [Xenopus laevis]Q9W769.1 RecName: Full=Homeobox protein vex1; AltName: Full=Homeodomain transcription factor vex-1; AltName: Full=Ventral homeobox protein; AltName: Full=Xvex-1 [Xenopus laevis]AAD42079.1 homeodomain transcription factor Xvex-1 [Xenopus laevis]OCT69972.1 hypothetical protein XELAEV_18036898mg [Xenopus laevis]
MEKRPYSVEWLSESSQRKAVYSNADLLGYKSGNPDKESNISLPSRATGPTLPSVDYREKENYCVRNVQNEERSPPVKDQLHSQPAPQELDTSRRALMVVPACERSTDQGNKVTGTTDTNKKAKPVCDEDAAARARTKFSPEQLEELERSFKENRYIGSSEKRRLSKVLKLSETQIKTWFQNRRMKFKRQTQDARVDAFFSGLYVPYYGYPDLPTPGYSVQPEFSVLAPHTMAAPSLPFGPLQSTVISPGLHPTAIPSANLGSYPYSSMLVHPMLNEPKRQRYSPY